MESDPRRMSQASNQSRWLLVLIEGQGFAMGAEVIGAVHPSCLPHQPDRYSAFLSAETHDGLPVFMRPLTELFKLADPHFFAESRPRPWCLVVRAAGRVRLGCWVDEVEGPLAATPSMGQIVHRQGVYLTALPAPELS